MYHRYFRFIQTLYKGVEKREENDAGKGWGWVVENDTISVVFTYFGGFLSLFLLFSTASTRERTVWEGGWTNEVVLAERDMETKTWIGKRASFHPLPYTPAKLIYFIGHFNGVLWDQGLLAFSPREREEKEQRKERVRGRQLGGNCEEDVFIQCRAGFIFEQQTSGWG